MMLSFKVQLLTHQPEKLLRNNCRYCLQKCEILWLRLSQEPSISAHVITDLFHGQLSKISKYIFVCKVEMYNDY